VPEARGLVSGCVPCRLEAETPRAPTIETLFQAVRERTGAMAKEYLKKDQTPRLAGTQANGR
jgi:hypothetical protein